MDELEVHWKQLNLSTEEDADILVDRVALVEELKKGENSLIGKLHTDRHISKEILKNTMAKAWETTSSFSVKEIQVNSFIFSFDSPHGHETSLKPRALGF